MNKEVYSSLEQTAKLALHKNQIYLASVLYGVMAEYIVDECAALNSITLRIGEIRKTVNGEQELTVTEHDSLIN